MKDIDGAFSWQRGLIQDLQCQLGADVSWSERLRSAMTDSLCRLHLAVFVEPYLRFVLKGKKTVESRFSVNRCSPYRQVSPRDIVILKKSGGPVCGVCYVKEVWFYKIEESSFNEIRSKFERALCIPNSTFWDQKRRARYATLMLIGGVREVNSIDVAKRDRRGWVVISK